MGFLTTLLLGTGKLKPELKAALEAEGVVLVEEGLLGSVRYRHFKAPGKRFHGKITGERMGLGISQERVVVYCRSGKGKLIDTEFGNPRWDWVEVAVDNDEAVAFRVDYDKQTEEPKISGQLTVRARTPNAHRIVQELQSRIAAARTTR